MVWFGWIWFGKEKKRRCEANDMADSLTCLIVASRYWEYQGERQRQQEGGQTRKTNRFNGMQSIVVIPCRLKKGGHARFWVSMQATRQVC
jgi:hypothetical protein